MRTFPRCRYRHEPIDIRQSVCLSRLCCVWLTSSPPRYRRTSPFIGKPSSIRHRVHRTNPPHRRLLGHGFWYFLTTLENRMQHKPILAPTAPQFARLTFEFAGRFHAACQLFDDHMQLVSVAVAYRPHRRTEELQFFRASPVFGDVRQLKRLTTLARHHQDFDERHTRTGFKALLTAEFCPA